MTEPVQAFIDALWQAAEAIEDAHDEHGPLPDTASLTPDEAHRLRVGCWPWPRPCTRRWRC